MLKSSKYRSRSLILLMLAGGMAVSCAKEASVDNPGEESRQTGIPIELRGMFGPEKSAVGPALKAQADGGALITPELTLWFARADQTAPGVWGSYISGELYATRPQAKGDAPTELVFPDPQPCYLSGDLKTKLTGWYPGGGLAGSRKGYWNGTSVVWQMDGLQDIMTASAQEGDPVTKMPAFVFNHRTAQLRFYIWAETVAEAAFWGDIHAVKVLDQPDVCTYTPSADEETGSVKFSGSAAFTVLNAPLTPAVTTSKTDVPQAGSTLMIAPQTAAYTLTLEVTTEIQGTVVVQLPARAYQQAGTYCIYLKLSAADIFPTVNISDWKALVEKDVEL